MHWLIKIEKYLFYLLLFSIPFQTRKILWQQEWYFNEWQTISLYGTDLLVLILFIFWAFNFKGLKFKTCDYFLIAFLGISAVSIKNSSNIYLSLFSLVKLAEFAVFYFYLKSYAIEKFGLLNSFLAILAGGFFQALIAIIQFFKQSDIGLRLLGEPIINSNLIGVASFYNLAGEKIIRAYGTTPHPNILAAYLFLAIFAFYYMWIYEKLNKKYLLVYGLIFLALFFTFSRVVIFFLGLNFLLRVLLIRLKFRKEYWNKKLASLFTVTVLIILMFCIFNWSEAVSRMIVSSSDEALQMRIYYNQKSINEFNWFGVGTGNFVNFLINREPYLVRYMYQPVHNIYLLIYSETGLFGISAFIIFLVFLVKDYLKRTKLKTLKQYSLLLVFSSFLFMGFFDHFLWTLQQGRLMFWSVIALLASDVV